MARTGRDRHILTIALLLTGAVLVASTMSCTPTEHEGRVGDAVREPRVWELTVRLPGFPPIRVFGVSGPGDLVTAPLVVVMHGTERNASEYRDTWVPLAGRRSVIVVVPEFPDADFPGSAAYNLGGVMMRNGRLRPADTWTFATIEPIVDAVRRELGNTTVTFAMFGHSAGAQFVHRYLEFMPAAPVSRAVVANAGWYTVPDRSEPFPYGLDGLPDTTVDRRSLFARDLIVMLGSDDVASENLRQDKGANRQGGTRLARGLYFYERGRRAARELGMTFRWRLTLVPGVDHDHEGMSIVAVDTLLGPTE